MTEPATQPARRNAPLAEPPETLRPALVGEIPGPASRALAKRLAKVESRNVTALDPIPIFWERATFANLWDVDGNRFVDLTAAFGVANVGHAHPEVVEAISSQAESLLHGMGDVHPPRVKVELLEELSAHGIEGKEAERLAAQRSFPGNRPSNTILLDRLDPPSLGALLALYEHKVFVQGAIWNVNSFDQWGVELGKGLAKGVLKDLRNGHASSGHDQSTAALIERICTIRGKQ